MISCTPEQRGWPGKLPKNRSGQSFSVKKQSTLHRTAVSPAVCSWNRFSPFSAAAPKTRRKLSRHFLKNARRNSKVNSLRAAGPCGYGLYRQITSMGHTCIVAAASLIPRMHGDLVKNDRKDARKQASHYRNGDLVPVWVPDEENEALRDLLRARQKATVGGPDVKQNRHCSGFFCMVKVSPAFGGRIKLFRAGCCQQ